MRAAAPNSAAYKDAHKEFLARQREARAADPPARAAANARQREACAADAPSRAAANAAAKYIVYRALVIGGKMKD